MTSLSSLLCRPKLSSSHTSPTGLSSRGRTIHESPIAPVTATSWLTHIPLTTGESTAPHTPFHWEPLHKQEAPILLQISVQEKEYLKTVPTFGDWQKEKESSYPPLSNNHCSFSAQDMWDISLGKLYWIHKLCSIYCLSFGLKCHFRPYLHVHLEQLFIHSADDIQVFTLRLVCCGIHWLHRMESVTLKQAHVT